MSGRILCAPFSCLPCLEYCLELRIDVLILSVLSFCLLCPLFVWTDWLFLACAACVHPSFYELRSALCAVPAPAAMRLPSVARTMKWRQDRKFLRRLQRDAASEQSKRRKADERATALESTNSVPGWATGGGGDGFSTRPAAAAAGGSSGGV